MNKHWWLYVLKLEQGKYYVGITSKSVEARFAQHKKGFAGASWTKKYKPLEIYYSQDLGVVTKEKAELFEAKTTRKYIEKYGLDNVRGGDITVTEELINVGGRYVLKENWFAILTIFFLLLIIGYLVLFK